MKTKLRTFARKQILRKPVRNFWKNDWNIAFTWLKHNVKPTGFCKTNQDASSFCKKVTDLYKQSSRRVSLAIGAYWNPWWSNRDPISNKYPFIKNLKL